MKKAFMIIWTIILWIVWIFWLVLWIIKNSDAYKTLEKEILTNRSIASEYWNVNIWFLPMWSVEVSWSEWNANLQVSINWNGKDWTVFANLIKKNNQWTITDFKFTNNKNKKMQNQELNQDKDSFTEEDDWFWLRYNIPWPKDNPLDHLNQENQEYIQNSLWSKMQIIWTGKWYFRMKADFYGVEISVPAQRKNYWWFTKYETLHIYPSNDTWEYVPKNDITIKFLKNWFLDERKNWWWSAFEQSYNEAEKELTNMYEWYKTKFWSWNTETYRLSFEKDQENNQIRYSLRNIISPYISWANSMYVIFIKNPDKTSNQWINIAYIWEDKNLDSYTKLLKKMIESMKVDRNYQMPSEQYLLDHKLIWLNTHLLWNSTNNKKENNLIDIKNKIIQKYNELWFEAQKIDDMMKNMQQTEYSFDTKEKAIIYYQLLYDNLLKLPNNSQITTSSWNTSITNSENQTLSKIKKRYIDHSVTETSAEEIISNIKNSMNQLDQKQRTEMLDGFIKQLK